MIDTTVTKAFLFPDNAAFTSCP